MNFGSDRPERVREWSPATRYQKVRSFDREEQAALVAQIEQAAAAQSQSRERGREKEEAEEENRERKRKTRPL